ncbi:biotin--[acetyl-CoA-carboxylase] ligase [Acetobacter pomorum]|uniref:biotin--[biotin carboxyl-carrier protein] ligase n=1 Tax=Acetobacter pomorum TaxID=65959 RepID=A0A2G4RBZ3_9PROT|nr:biotin--[acetyl-CoA-carboxylase] ligase [Acetobacter pomorum]PHY94084.1 biotin--[acetyl-CoA-carboxylase] ligase [Acetobacter pomorum]
MKDQSAAWRLECFAELGSTSDYCLEQARHGAASGLAVLAYRQTQGRGSRGRQWVDAGKSLALSVLLDVQQAGQDMLGGWPFAASLAFYEGMLHAVPAVAGHLMIKWPNDLLLDGQKVGGILIEREGAHLVIGFGANLTQVPSQHQTGRFAACLGQYGQVPPVENVARFLLSSLTEWCTIWQQQGFGVLRQAWLERAHPVGTPLVVSSRTTYEQGKFAGLAQDGRLLLDTETGMKTITTGDILLEERG